MFVNIFLSVPQPPLEVLRLGQTVGFIALLWGTIAYLIYRVWRK